MDKDFCLAYLVLVASWVDTVWLRDSLPEKKLNFVICVFSVLHFVSSFVYCATNLSRLVVNRKKVSAMWKINKKIHGPRTDAQVELSKQTLM